MASVLPNAVAAKLERLEIPNVEFYSKEVVNVPQAISGGFTEFKKGELVTGEIEHDEIALVLEGELEIKDEIKGTVQHARKGDVFYFSKGAKLILIPKPSVRYWYVNNRQHS